MFHQVSSVLQDELYIYRFGWFVGLIFVHLDELLFYLHDVLLHIFNSRLAGHDFHAVDDYLNLRFERLALL
ncbi:MAG TPA: hypothetical protein VLF69_02985 [Candidatus Saccharimonadales bacterium]|nr:hypothetical protein [Candidatus Saccharimonadales bacterium]